MIRSIAKKITLLTQWLGLVAALLIIGMVIIIFLGRQTIGQLDELRPTIQSFIESNTGFKVSLGTLSGEWPQLIPIIDIQSVELINPQQNTVLSFNGARAEIDLFSSIKLGSPIWRELAIDQLEINFFENALGHWRLEGFDSESKTDLNIILEPFLFSRQIRLETLRVNLHAFSGQKTQLLGSQMLIENDHEFHRAQLSVSFAKGDSPAHLIVEANGQLSDLNSFKANGYLKFEELNLSEPLKIFTQSLAPSIPRELDQYAIKSGGEIWLDFRPGKQLDYKGKLSLSNAPLNWLADDVPPVSDIKTSLTGWYMPGKDWGMRLQDLQFDLGSTTIEPVNILYSQQLGSHWQEFDISINHINVELVTDLIYESQALPIAIVNRLKRVKPKGNISSLSAGRSETGFYLSANLDGCYMQPISGIPGLKDIHGYLEIKDSNGLFHIADDNGFEILFPKSYREYHIIKEAKGTVYFDWRSPNQRIVYSDRISTKLEAGNSQLQFTIEQPIGGESKGAEFNLLIGARDLDLSLTDTYLPYTMPDKTSKWLSSAIEEGNLKQFGLLFRTGPPIDNPLSRTTQLLFDVDNATIKFNPNWPRLQRLDGLFLVDSGNLSAQIRSAGLNRAAVSKTRIKYSVKPPAEERKWVIDGHLEADLSAMIDILDQSPLSQNLGPMSAWDYSGNTTTRLYMELPSYIADKKNPPKIDYRVTSLIDNAKMAITGSPITLDKLTGEVEFSSEKGIYAPDLSAQLWGKPFNAKLYRNAQQQMSFTTTIAPKSLDQFTNSRWQTIFSDDIVISGLLSKDPKNFSKTLLSIESDMQGVAINLPAPIGKTSEQRQPLALKLHFDPGFSQFEGRLGPNMLADIRFEESRLKQGVISYDRALVMPSQEVLLISANLPTIDFNVWQPLSYLMDQNPTDDRAIKTVFDIELAQWKFAGIELSEVSAKIKPVTSGFDAEFTSDLADGSLTLYKDASQPAKVALNRLSVSGNLGRNNVNVDPREFLAVDFSVDHLSVAERDLGSLSFELRPESSGASFNNIGGDIIGLQPGIFASEAPTEFFWGYNGQAHFSQLVGPIGINNIGHLFNVFDLPQVLDSKSGRLDADLSWRGMPWAISKENLMGDFKINLVEGNFYRTPTGAGAALKLVGLFNFANWLRRLQLDFSDVVGQNLAYRRLDGTLSFDLSVLTLDEPLKIDMPSGKMSMAGNFDLGFETLDAKLVATLPVATNLPWLVGLTGGLPAALGVYATSKLVEEQVDRLSSISYKMSGPWDDVEVAVDKIFAAELPESSQ